MRLITIWPHLLSLSSTLFFYSSYTLTPVSLGHCMALDIMQTIKPETPHPTSCESFCDSMGPFLFYCCGTPLYQKRQHFLRIPHQVSYTGVVGQQETLMQKCLTIPSTFLNQEKVNIGKWKYTLPVTQCKRDLALSSTHLMAPQRSRRICVTKECGHATTWGN